MWPVGLEEYAAAAPNLSAVGSSSTSGSSSGHAGFPSGGLMALYNMEMTMMMMRGAASAGGSSGGGGSNPGGLMFRDQIMDSAGVPLDRALLASKNHREAERRRRERIKSHLDRLRHLLACDPKIDKASLLAKAVEHVRHLKQRAAEIPDLDRLPAETDEITVVCCSGHSQLNHDDEFAANALKQQPQLIRASVCCEDRSGLLLELEETLRSLKMRALRAEMATLGGRVRNVLVVASEAQEHDAAAGTDIEGLDGCGAGPSVELLRDALKALVERPGVGAAAAEGRMKRRRVVDQTVP